MKLAAAFIFIAAVDAGKNKRENKIDAALQKGKQEADALAAQFHADQADFGDLYSSGSQRVNSNGVYNDIMLTNVQRLFLDGSLDGNGRTLSSDERTAIKNKEWKLWTDKSGNYIVPYYFDTKFPSSARDRVRKAIQDFTDTTCIRFTETRISDRSYDHRIRVSDTGKGCFSYVGLVDSVSSQDLSLDVVQCTDETWEIQHEFMHALGFWHEQQRGDRDDYVYVDRGNCLQSHFAFSVNYGKLGPNHPFIDDEWLDLGDSYDYNSIMQYDGTFCQITSQPVISYSNNRKKAVVPNAKRLSSLDVIQINKKYQCHRIDKKYLNLGKCGGNPAEHKKYFIQEHKCDGIKDCEDGTDERDCSQTVQKDPTTTKRTTTTRPTTTNRTTTKYTTTKRTTTKRSTTKRSTTTRKTTRATTKPYLGTTPGF